VTAATKPAAAAAAAATTAAAAGAKVYSVISADGSANTLIWSLLQLLFAMYQ
jgi:hypothetical protein